MKTDAVCCHHLQGQCVGSSGRGHDLAAYGGSGEAVPSAIATDNGTPDVTVCSFLKTAISDEPLTPGASRRLLECEHCHKQFTSRFNLQRHQLIHTGAKPYECPLCQQRFNQSGHVKTHLRTRHPTHEPTAVTADNGGTAM